MLQADPSRCRQKNAYSGHARPLKRDKSQAVVNVPTTGTAGSNLDLPQCVFRNRQQHARRMPAPSAPPLYMGGAQGGGHSGGQSAARLGISITRYNQSPRSAHDALRAQLQSEQQTSRVISVDADHAHLMPKIQQAVKDKVGSAATLIKIDARSFQLRAFGAGNLMTMFVDCLTVKDEIFEEDRRMMSAPSQYWTQDGNTQGDQNELFDVVQGSQEFLEVEKNFTRQNQKKDLK